MTTGVLTFIASLLTTGVATKLLIPFLRSKGILDLPNERSSHTAPTPRGGGIGIICGLACGLCVAWLSGAAVVTWQLLLGGAVVAVIGFIDDRRGLPVSVRLGLQVLAAAVVLHGSAGLERLPLPAPLDLDAGSLGTPLALLWIVGVTNIYNFLDGIDGYAGLQGVIAGLGLAFLSPGGAAVTAGLAIAGACLGFVLHNWHPAKVFMGDVGSGTLGFLLAALPLQADYPSRSVGVFVAAMCLWFFLSDGCFTILCRLARGERIWSAHRSHVYQRLVQTGLRHDQVSSRVMYGAAAIAALAVSAARLRDPSALWGVLAAAVFGFGAYYYWTWSRERVYVKTRAGDRA